MLCNFTNANFEATGMTKKSYVSSWAPVTPLEMEHFIGLLFYMSIVTAPNIDAYWSQSTLYSGLWARALISSRTRYRQINSFLKITDHTQEDSTDKLTKVRFLYDIIKCKCKELYQPHSNVSIDERMVRNKGRYSFRQYIKDKPTKWGMKWWVLADSCNGYTYDFDLYLGRSNIISKFGLGYDVVMKLVTTLFDQGYRLFTDNFYTSTILLIDLLKKGIMACGTILLNRKGIPADLKDTSTLNKARGSNRFVREGNLLFMQWRDNKIVNFLSTIHTKSKEIFYCKRRSKLGNKFQKLEVEQPYLVRDYNKYMSGVDRSDQLICKYNTLRKTDKYWKTIFYHLLDIARINSYILYKEHTNNKHLGQLDFTLQLIRQLGNINEDTPVPIYNPTDIKIKEHHAIVMIQDNKKNCKQCYTLTKKQVKTVFYCKTCGHSFCLTSKRNCMLKAHFLSSN